MAVATEKLCFFTLGGEALVLDEEPSSVAIARKQIAQAQNVKYPSQIVFILPDGGELKDSNDLPKSTIQVQTNPPPAGTWSRIMWDADQFDELALRVALDNAFPPPICEVDFDDDPPPGWHAPDYWSDDEKWAKWTSGKMQQATIRAVGAWANYWGFAAMADTYGYWMVEAPYRSKQKSIELYVSNVKHWRSVLHDLDASFDAIKDRTKGMNAAETWEIAAAELLNYSRKKAIKTSFKYGFETWYWPFVQVLEWFSDVADLELPSKSCNDLKPDFKANGFLKMILTPLGRGVFRSYSVKADGAKLFAELMAKHYGINYESFDSTAQWMEQRPLLADIPAKGLADASPFQDDVHFKYICSTDFARGAERAERLKEGLFAVRCDARDNRQLTIDMLCQWQKCVLGLATEPPIRCTDAYAKAGRERYPCSAEFKAEFEKVLSEAEAEATPDMPALAPEVRAARVYLDVCFFHPFDDGNGRLARLVLDFLLTKAGLCLRDIDDLFAKSRMASDQVGTKIFVEAIKEYTAPLGLERDNDLRKWSTDWRDASLLKIKKRKYDGTDYEWFDCVCEDAKLDRE